ncbi:MAG: S8 family serine peptidase [Rhodothermales bacterium]|nr:S8 family serine peptidase [Rhodothermales bacterium]
MIRGGVRTHITSFYGLAPVSGLRVLWLLGLVLAMVLLVPAARGQAEMIVRVEEESRLLRTLESTAKTGVDPGDETLASVRRVRRLFDLSLAMGKSGQQPFPVYLVDLPDSSSLDAAMIAWGRRSDVRYVQHNHTYSVDAADDAPDPLADSLDHFAVVGVAEAWKLTTGSPDVTVGLVDTGVSFDHPDLLGQFAVRIGEDIDGDGRLTAADLNGLDDDGNGYVDDVSGYDFVDRPQTVDPGDFHDPDPVAEDDGSGHGTNVAGIVGAANSNGVGISGLAPGVRLVPLRAFGRDGRGDDDDIARAVVYAAENQVSVLNLSFGDIHVSPLMQDAIRYAVERGVVVVASAGNVGGDKPHYPSDYPEVLSVAWLSADGSSLSSRGSAGVGVDIGAPGSSIFTTVSPDGAGGENVQPEDYYGRRSGSSMAAPMVAAAAALIRSMDPSLSPASIRSSLAASATDLSEEGWDHGTGAGLLNVGRALLRSLPGRVEITDPEMNAGIVDGPVLVRGTAVDPSFRSYQLSYAAGDDDLSASDFNMIGIAQSQQIWNGLLGQWDISGLVDGLYTLRLSVELRTGAFIEERRRVFVDRTAPVATVSQLGAGLVGGRHGIIADIATDDLTDVVMTVSLGGVEYRTFSDRTARRHGLYWAEQTKEGGDALVTVTSRNAAGLEADTVLGIIVPRHSANSSLLNVSDRTGPDGFLLEALTDFDGDGLREVTLNRYEDGWIGDTVAVLEWGGSSFRRASSLLAGVIPRDIGDSDGDGLLELLTQVGPATLLIEQSPAGYPQNLIFADTSGLSGNQNDALWGARLTDMDSDGRVEIIGHNTREWRMLEWSGTSFEEVARVSDPTGVADSELGENTFEQPYAVIGDFDGDGHQEMLTGDSDGDWIIYESSSDNMLEAVWSYETNRYDAGSRLAVGDLNGDGRSELIVYNHNWLTTTTDGEREPDMGRYSVFTNVGDNSFDLAAVIPVSGEITRHGSLATTDIDADGVDDLVIVNPPDLYVLTFDAALNPTMIFHAGLDDPPGFKGFRSTRIVVGDIDSDGLNDIVLADAEVGLRVVSQNATTRSLPVPAWVSAIAIDDSAVRLTWLSTGADSVHVYRATAGEEFQRVATTSDGPAVDSVSVRSEYMVRGWYAGNGGPLSRIVKVRPHVPATVSSLLRRSRSRVEIAYTEPLDPAIRAEQFLLVRGGRASSLLQGKGGQSVLLDFPDAVTSADTLRWQNLADAEGTPVQQTAVVVPSFEESDRSLIVQSWSLPSSSAISIVFSAPLDPSHARDVQSYRVSPNGTVSTAVFDESRPSEVLVEFEGVAVGATGLESSLTVLSMMSVDGRWLAPEGATIQLSGPSANLADVFVFPNPYRQSTGSGRLVVAGLPSRATIDIYSPEGVLVRQIEESDGNGGAVWDLRDSSGSIVPSGIYLMLVRSEGLGSVLKKAAVIQ